MSGLKKRGAILSFVATAKRSSLLLVLLGSYLFVGFIFGLLYQVTGSTTASNYWESVYFSLVSQGTGGLGDVQPTTGIGQLLASIQAVAGVIWIAIVPAAVLVRLLAPDPASIVFSSRLAFDPDRGIFILRVVNTSRMIGENTQVVIRLNRRLKSSFHGRRIVALMRSDLDSEYRFPRLRPMEEYTFGTDPARGTPPDIEQRVFQTTLHPGHMDRDRTLHAQVSFEVMGSKVFREYIYPHNDILCGKFVNMRLTADHYDWGLINEVDPIFVSQESGRYCTSVCQFRTECGITNKVDLPGLAASTTDPGSDSQPGAS